MVGGRAGPDLHASIGARGALSWCVAGLSCVWWPRAACRPVISHVFACVRVPVSGCFTGSHRNTVAMCSPLAHVLRTRSLFATVVFDCRSFALACARARLSLAVAGTLSGRAFLSALFFGCGVHCAAAFWRGDGAWCLCLRRRELTVQFGDVELCDDDTARVRAWLFVVGWWGRVWDRGRPRLEELAWRRALSVFNSCRSCGRGACCSTRVGARSSLVAHLARFVGGSVGLHCVARWGSRAPCRALSRHTRHNRVPARSRLPGCSMWRRRVARSRVAPVGSSISSR